MSDELKKKLDESIERLSGHEAANKGAQEVFDDNAKQLQDLRDRLDAQGILRITPDAMASLMEERVEGMTDRLEKHAQDAADAGDIDLRNFFMEEVQHVRAGTDMPEEHKERAAKLAEEEGKPELARLIRGEVTPQELAERGIHDALVEFAEGIGGVIVHEYYDPPFRQISPEEQEAMIRNLQQNPHLMRPIMTVAPLEQRIMSMLSAVNDKLELVQERAKRMEEEIMFTSSANRFAHLRSGIEQNTIPRLPPAPDWNTLETYAEPLLRDIVDHIKGAPILADRANITGMLPMDILRGVDVVGEELLRIVRERGRAYGEEAILAMGEAGLISMIMSKVMRLMWSHRGGAYFQSRRDSYIDLAGYCLLTIALDEFITNESGKE